MKFIKTFNESYGHSEPDKYTTEVVKSKSGYFVGSFGIYNGRKEFRDQLTSIFPTKEEAISDYMEGDYEHIPVTDNGALYNR